MPVSLSNHDAFKSDKTSTGLVKEQRAEKSSLQMFLISCCYQRPKNIPSTKNMHPLLDGDQYYLGIVPHLPSGPCSLTNLWSAQLYKEICGP